MEDANAQKGLAKGIAQVAGVPVEYVQLNLSVARRLISGNKVSLLVVTLVVDFTITFPSGAVVEPSAVLSNLNSKALDEFTEIIQTEVTHASSVSYTVAVVSRTEALLTSFLTSSTLPPIKVDAASHTGLDTASVVGIVLASVFFLPVVVVMGVAIVMVRGNREQDIIRKSSREESGNPIREFSREKSGDIIREFSREKSVETFCV